MTIFRELDIESVLYTRAGETYSPIPACLDRNGDELERSYTANVELTEFRPHTQDRPEEGGEIESIEVVDDLTNEPMDLNDLYVDLNSFDNGKLVTKYVKLYDYVIGLI